jgi:hypothetical protein
MAVPDAQPAVVAPGPEHVSGLPVPSAREGDRPGDLAGCERGGAGALVERVDVQTGPGQHQRVLPLGARLGPVREDAVEGGVAVSAGVQSTGGPVGGQRVRVAVPEREGGLAFPRLAEPVDLVELDAVAGAGQGGQHPARAVDHPDLRRVADQHHLRPHPRGRGDERVEIQRAGHRRLIDDHHRPAVQHRRALRAVRGAGGCVVAGVVVVCSHLATVSAGPPVVAASSAAARADGANPTTR